jgi:hypothetical protein
MHVSLEEIIIHGSPLPAGFLILRRDALQVAVARQFSGSYEPMPEMQEWPGVFKPTPGISPIRERQLAAHRLANHRYRESHPRAKAPKKPYSRHSQAKGSILPGSTVPMFKGPGTVLAFVPKGENPMAALPAGTPHGRISGAPEHGPAGFPRYVVSVMVHGDPRYYFPKAATLERSVK